MRNFAKPSRLVARMPNWSGEAPQGTLLVKVDIPIKTKSSSESVPCHIDRRQYPLLCCLTKLAQGATIESPTISSITLSCTSIYISGVHEIAERVINM